MEATTGDRCLNQAPDALVIRIENTYEQGGEHFWVDLDVKWPSDSCTLTVNNDAQPYVDYDVQSYLVHRPQKELPVSEGRKSGHYLAYFKHGAV